MNWKDIGIEIPTNGKGPEVYLLCPKCSNSRKKKGVKCLSANIEKNAWLCHHCGWGGTLKDGEKSAPNPTWWTEAKYRKPENYAGFKSLSGSATKWLMSRGLTKEVLERNDIGHGSVYMPQVEDFVSAIQFPFKRGGEVVNIKYRDGQKNFRQEAGCERVLFGLDDIAETTIIVEGEIDKLSFEVSGLKNCVSVPDGAPSPKSKNYESKFEFLHNCKNELAKVKTFVIAVDNDDPGKVLEAELVRRLGPERCKVVNWHEGSKDANEVLVKFGPDELLDYYAAATPCPVSGVYDIESLSGRIDHLYHKGVDEGTRLGWNSLNPYYRIRVGEFTIVTGIPSHGKSEFVDGIIMNLAEKEGWKTGFFSPENQPLERHFAKLAEKHTGKPFFQSIYRERMTGKDLQKAKDFCQEHFFFILPEDNENTLDGILSKAKTLVFRHGIKGLVIDPWNEIEHQRKNGMSETEYISLCLTKIRKFARAHQVHVWVVAHPTKLMKDKDGKYPVPTPYDISGSSHWRNKADMCLAIWRDVEANNDITDIHIQKVRFKECGEPGVAQLEWDRASGRFKDLQDS